MKNQTITPREKPELKAQKAIHKIHKWAEKRYPNLASITRSRLIVECLIEMAEENKYLAARQ